MANVIKVAAILVGAEEFRAALVRAKEDIGVESSWRVTVHTLQEYEEMVAKGGRLFVTGEGSTFAITADGDIISVCRAGKDRGMQILATAVALGGRKLDSYLGNLQFYQRCGFELAAVAEAIIGYMDEFRAARKEVANKKGEMLPLENVGAFLYRGTPGRKYKSDWEFIKKSPQKFFWGDSGYDRMIEARDEAIAGLEK